jgi:hypothetical protein
MTRQDLELIAFGACLQNLGLLKDLDPTIFKDARIRCLLTAFQANPGKASKDIYQVKTWLDQHRLPENQAIIRGIISKLTALRAAEKRSDEAYQSYLRLKFMEPTSAATPSTTPSSAMPGPFSTNGVSAAGSTTAPPKPKVSG